MIKVRVGNLGTSTGTYKNRRSIAIFSGGQHRWSRVSHLSRVSTSMSARLTKTLLARVATDANLRKESAAQAKELKKRRKEAAKNGKSISTGKRPGKKRKLKRKVKAKDERRTNFLEDAAKEIQRRDRTQRNVRLLTTRRDFTGRSDNLMRKLLGVDDSAQAGGDDDLDDDLFDF